MAAPKLIVLLFILPPLIRSASKPNRKRSPKYQDIQELITNAGLLRSYTKSVNLEYVRMTKKFCIPKLRQRPGINQVKNCKCSRIFFSFGLIKQISEQTITRAVADIQRSLYPFIELLTGITQQERNPKLNGKLQKIGKRLNETYDTAIDMMVKTGQSVKNLTTKAPSIKDLDKITYQFTNSRGFATRKREFRNYFVLYELQRTAIDITYSLGKLNQFTQGK